MKKIFTIVGVVLMLSLVLAVEGQGAGEVGVGSDSLDLGAEAQGGGDGSQVGSVEGQKVQLQIGEHVGVGGQQIMIQQESNNQIRLEVGGKSAKSSMVMSQEMVNGEVKLSTQLSNGKSVEIKVMPDAASEVAMNRLKLKTCSEDAGCSIELKEVGAGDKASLAYEVKTQRQSKILGLFGASMQVQAQVNAETGELLSVNKPWWAFLASESEE